MLADVCKTRIFSAEGLDVRLNADFAECSYQNCCSFKRFLFPFSQLDFSLSSRSDLLSEEIETALRCQRLVNAGYWIAEDFPRFNSIRLFYLCLFVNCWHFLMKLRVRS